MANKELSNNQKKFLRKLAHSISPVVMIGQNGLSDGVVDELVISMEKHEILKLKVRVEKEDKQQIIDKVLAITNAQLIQVVGNVIVIYRSFEEPQIILPRK